jgi:HK97 family phage portal protein
MFERVKKLFETRKTAMIGDASSWLTAVLEKTFSQSGININPDNALNSTAVYACIRVIAETVASLPLCLYRWLPDDGGKERDDKHPLSYILHDAPNYYQTSFEFREMMVGHLCMRGNFYAQKVYSQAGKLLWLLPMNPGRMEVEMIENGDILYRYTYDDGQKRVFTQNEIWHVKGMSSDGLLGLSPITLAREAIGLSLAAESYGSRFFANNAKPGGILSTPGKLSQTARDNIKLSWQSGFTGENQHKVAVVEEGLNWQAIGFNNNDAQWLAGREFQLGEIARIFRVPGVLVGMTDKTATYSSAEQFFLNFVVHTVRPWCVRIEQSINNSLLPINNRTYFAEHIIDGLMRGDIVSRYTAYATARQWGWLSVNDIRKLENLNPVEEGDIYLQPMNMVEAGTPPPEPEPKLITAPLEGDKGNVQDGQNGKTGV